MLFGNPRQNILQDTCHKKEEIPNTFTIWLTNHKKGSFDDNNSSLYPASVIDKNQCQRRKKKRKKEGKRERIRTNIPRTKRRKYTHLVKEGVVCIFQRRNFWFAIPGDGTRGNRTENGGTVEIASLDVVLPCTYLDSVAIFALLLPRFLAMIKSVFASRLWLLSVMSTRPTEFFTWTSIWLQQRMQMEELHDLYSWCKKFDTFPPSINTLETERERKYYSNRLLARKTNRIPIFKKRLRDYTRKKKNL